MSCLNVCDANREYNSNDITTDTNQKFIGLCEAIKISTLFIHVIFTLLSCALI